MMGLGLNVLGGFLKPKTLNARTQINITIRRITDRCSSVCQGKTFVSLKYQVITVRLTVD